MKTYVFFPMTNTGLFVLKKDLANENETVKQGWEHALNAATGRVIQMLGEERVSSVSVIKTAITADLSQRQV